MLKGNPGKRSPKPREPRPPKQVPTCPRWINPEAKGCWRHNVPLLKQMGILARADRDALTAYCQTYSRWKAAEQFLAKHGEVSPYVTRMGTSGACSSFP